VLGESCVVLVYHNMTCFFCHVSVLNVFNPYTYIATHESYNRSEVVYIYSYDVVEMLSPLNILWATLLIHSKLLDCWFQAAFSKKD